MADETIKIEPSDFGSNAIGATLTVDLDARAIGAEIAAAMASAISAGIRTQAPKWNKTGTLANGITVVVDGKSHNVCAPVGRLDRPELIDKLRDDVAALASPLASAAVAKAIKSAVSKAVRVAQ
jgi:hypothetical protein